VPRYIILTRQTFDVTYDVEADSPIEAWDRVVDGDAELIGRVPGDIVGNFTDAHFVLDGKTVEHAGSAPYRDDPPRAHRLERHNSLPLAFDGWVLGRADSRDTSGAGKAAWSEVTIYRTTTGKWVAVQARRTAKPAEDRAVIRVCEQPADVIAALTAREGYLTKVAVAALTAAIDSDPDLESIREERI
jgi:hypothetical protein